MTVRPAVSWTLTWNALGLLPSASLSTSSTARTSARGILPFSLPGDVCNARGRDSQTDTQHTHNAQTLLGDAWRQQVRGQSHWHCLFTSTILSNQSKLTFIKTTVNSVYSEDRCLEKAMTCTHAHTHTHTNVHTTHS